MRRKKTLQELTLKDNFMFGAVMTDEENCREFLEFVLQKSLDRLEISKEKSMIYHPEYKGIRLDVYAKDEQNTHYNVEMQVLNKHNLSKRSRYYHSQMDMELLRRGEDYRDLPDTYVIFVCDFDPFGQSKYCYTFRNCCIEDHALSLKDGCTTIFLSTCGKNEDEVPGKLVKFLEFVQADLEESGKDFEDTYVKKLQESIRRIKTNRDMEARYMTLEELLKEERAEAREEGRKEGEKEGIREITDFVSFLMEKYGRIPICFWRGISERKDLTILQEWRKDMEEAKTIEEFEQRINVGKHIK